MPVSAPTSPARPRNGRQTAPKTFRAICDEIRRLRYRGLTWRAIASGYRLPDGRPINFASLRYIYTTQREPRRVDLRHALGLPEYVLVAVCPRCGEPPVNKRHKCADAHPRTRTGASGRRMTVGVWAGDYETWRERNLAEIEKIVEWAISPAPHPPA